MVDMFQVETSVEISSRQRSIRPEPFPPSTFDL